MKALVGVALLATLTLTACDDGAPDPHANDKCVHSHMEDQIVPILVGVDSNGIPSYIYTDMPQSVCDKWVPKEK